MVKTIGVVGGGVVGHATARYKRLPGHPGHRVGDDGSVWTNWEFIRKGTGGGVWTDGRPWRRLKVHYRKRGYAYVNLSGPGTGWRSEHVHVLVLRSFVGPRPKGMEILHGPGGKYDNRLSNLRYGTPKENKVDMYRDGTVRLGTDNASSKMTEEVVRQSRSRFKQGHSITRLAKETGVTMETMRRAVRKITWRHVT